MASKPEPENVGNDSDGEIGVEDLENMDFTSLEEQEEETETVNPDTVDTLEYDLGLEPSLIDSKEESKLEEEPTAILDSSGEENDDKQDRDANCNKEISIIISSKINMTHFLKKNLASPTSPKNPMDNRNLAG